MIILINGSINSGKTTVAKILAGKLPQVALVEIDVLRGMIDWMPIDQAVSINLENAISIITNFVKRGLNVVVPYPLSQKNHDYLMSSLKDLNTKIYTFTLAPKFEKVITNRGSRELNSWELERIKYHYDVGIHKPTFGEVVDNTNQAPEETAQWIFSRVS